MAKKQILFLGLLLFGISIAGSAQVRVTGKVTDVSDNQPIPLVHVAVKGQNITTESDALGSYSIEVPEGNHTLVFSAVGYPDKEENIGKRTVVNVSMSMDAEMLDDLVVVAYGTAKRNAMSGAVTQLSGEKLSMKNSSEVTKALAGEVSGVQVYSSSGQPGSNATIRIRGIGSASSNNEPLYVVDGIPYGTDLSGISPTDIETTTILKDASATALYGTRAANGVILITTKKGVKGQTRVEADVKYGVNLRLIPLYNTMDSPEKYMETSWEGIKNFYQYVQGTSESTAATNANLSLWNPNYRGGISPGYNLWDTPDIIDPATGKFYEGVGRKYNPEKWEDHIFRSGQKIDASVRISGGSDKSSHFTSLGYLKDEGYYISSDFKRITARNNISHDVYSWLKTRTNLNYSYLESNSPGQSGSANNGFQFVNLMPSIFPVFERDADGNKVVDNVLGGYKYDYGMSQGEGRPYAAGINPAGAVRLDKKRFISHLVGGNGAAEVDFLKDFKFTTNIGFQYSGERLDDLVNPYYGDSEGEGRITKQSTSFISLTANQILNWKKTFGLHTFDAFVAHESYHQELSYMNGDKSKILSASSTEWNNAVIMGSVGSDTYGYNMESYFGQVRYDYDDKYHFNASLRRDGSSRFSDGNRWGTFGSAGFSWIISKESFMENVSWIKNLKYKLSYGIVGNQDFMVSPVAARYYPSYDLYSLGNIMNFPALTFSYKGNKDLTWEKSSSVNTGFEFSILDIFDVEFEYFNRTTKDMLYLKQVPISLGYSSYPVNDGQLRNQGIEISIKAHIVKTNDVKLNFNFNVSHYKNEMTQTAMDETSGKRKPIEVRSGYAWAKGHSLYDFYLRESAGVDPRTGLAIFNQYINVKEDGTRTIIHNMEDYKANNTIEKLEVETTDNWEQATMKFVGKSGVPTLTGGFGFDLNVKGFDLSATFTYGLGGYFYDNVYAALMKDVATGESNWHEDIERRWKAPGDVTDVPRLVAGTDMYTQNLSTRFLTSRSYLNLASVRLGYTLPSKLLESIKVKQLTVYVTGENLFLLSARKGSTPMGGVNGNTDISRYAPLSSIMGGIKLTF